MNTDPRGDATNQPSLMAELGADAVSEAKRWWKWAKRGAILFGLIGGIGGYVLQSWQGLLYGGGGGAAVGAVLFWLAYLQISADI